MENANKSSESSVKRPDVEEETSSKYKRFSILKIPRNDDVNSVRSSRRVSFSSNFIKTFSTDEDKNTIWDNTIEENINNSQSFSSLENIITKKENILDTSMFSNKVDVSYEDSISGNFKVTDNFPPVVKLDLALSEELLKEKENIPISLKGIDASAENVQGKAIHSISSRLKTKTVVKKSVETLKEWKKLKDDHPAVKIPLKPSNIKITDESDVDDMELTCQTIRISPDETASMEFTCHNVVMSMVEYMEVDSEESHCDHRRSVQGPTKTLDVEQSYSGDMEFTCANPVLPKSIHRESLHGSTNTDDAEQRYSGDMELTCANPVLPKSVHRESLHGSTKTDDAEQSYSGDMELTCANPLLPKSVHRESLHGSTKTDDAEQNYSGDMEFTCANPVLPKSVHRESLHVSTKTDDTEQSYSGDMELTCANPVLPKSVHRESLHESTKTDDAEQSYSRDMELTCAHPVLPKSVHRESLHGSTKTDDAEQNYSGDMELTCANPVLQKSIYADSMQRSTKTVDADRIYQESMHRSTKTVNAEQIHQESLHGSTKTDNAARSCSGDTECANPLLPKLIHHQSMQTPTKTLELEQCDDADMEFSFANPVLSHAGNVLGIQITDTNSLLSHSSRNQGNQSLTRSPKVEPSNIRDTENNCSNTLLSQSDREQSRRNLATSPMVVLSKKTDNNVQEDSCYSGVNDVSRGLLSFQNNVDESLVKEYSTFADATMQLIQSANNIINARNSTCDENSLTDVSKHQMNVTYQVVNGKESEKLVEQIPESDVGGKRNAENEPEDFFSKVRNVSNTNILEDCSIELQNMSSDNRSIESETCSNNLHIVEYLPEKKTDTTAQKIVITKDTPWSASEFYSKVQKDILEWREKRKAIKPPPLPDKSETVYLQKRIEDALIRSAKVGRGLDKKIEALKQYRVKVLEEIMLEKMQIEVPLETSNNESSTKEDKSDHVEDLSFPSIIEEIEQKAKACDDCWKIVRLDHSVGHFTTFYGKLLFTVECNANNFVTNLTTKSLLPEDSKPMAYFLQREMLHSLSTETLCNCIGQNYNILSLLDYIQMVMEKMKKYHREIKELEMKYQFTLTSNFKATFVILDLKLMNKWVFTMDLSDLEKMTRNSLSVHAPIGTVNEKYLQDLIAECPKGIDFIQNFFSKIQDYMKLLKKRKHFVKSKAMS